MWLIIRQMGVLNMILSQLREPYVYWFNSMGHGLVLYYNKITVRKFNLTNQAILDEALSYP